VRNEGIGKERNCTTDDGALETGDMVDIIVIHGGELQERHGFENKYRPV